MASPVLTSPLFFAGITVSSAAYRSYPAASADPRVGNLACATSFLICNMLNLDRDAGEDTGEEDKIKKLATNIYSPQ